MPERIDVSEFIITAAASAMNAQAWLSSPKEWRLNTGAIAAMATAPTAPSTHPHRSAARAIRFFIPSGAAAISRTALAAMPSMATVTTRSIAEL